MKFKSKLMTALTILRKSVVATVLSVMVVSSTLIVAIKAPEIHNQYLRAKVGSKVYMIKDQVAGGGGTGFAVQAPSGASYIMTNDHVCGVSKDGQTVLVIDQNGDMMRRRIIAHDGYSDLCLIEGMPGIKGLQLADEAPTPGDTTYVVGHPSLLPLSVQHGEMLGREDVTINMGPIHMYNPQNKTWEQLDVEKGAVLASQCTMPKNKVVQSVIDLMIVQIHITWCLVQVKDTYITNMTILPGNSGSPVVDAWGRVTGAAFATDAYNWGRVVSLYDLNSFLKNY